MTSELPTLFRVLLLSAIVWSASARAADNPVMPPDGPLPKTVAKGVLQIGYITEPDLKEDSGIIASRSLTNVFWTHTDGGKHPTLYAIDRTGKVLAQYPVVGAKLSDWEDIAMDASGHIYIADIGNNDQVRQEIAVYQVKEPDLAKSGHPIQIRRTYKLRWPDKPYDCESLFIYNNTGYVISKVFNKEQGVLYSFPLKEDKKPYTLQKIGTMQVNSPITGADISNDGKRLALVAHSGAFLFWINGDVAAATQTHPWHTRFAEEHIEGCTFVPDGLLVTSELRGVYLFTDDPFREP